MAAKKSVKHAAPDASARHLWLAGLGLTSIATRNTIESAGQFASTVTRLRERALSALGDTRALIGELREQVVIGTDQIGRNVESALSPLLSKWQPKKTQRKVRRGRKATAKKVRREARKTPAKPIKTRRR